MNKQDSYCYAVLMRAFEESDLTYQEMMQISGFSERTILTFVQNLKRQKLAHVCGYYKDAKGRDKIKIFRYGKGRDVAPSRLSDAEKQRRYQARLRVRSIPMSLIAA